MIIVHKSLGIIRHYDLYIYIYIYIYIYMSRLVKEKTSSKNILSIAEIYIYKYYFTFIHFCDTLLPATL